MTPCIPDPLVDWGGAKTPHYPTPSALLIITLLVLKLDKPPQYFPEVDAYAQTTEKCQCYLH